MQASNFSNRSVGKISTSCPHIYQPRPSQNCPQNSANSLLTSVSAPIILWLPYNRLQCKICLIHHPVNSFTYSTSTHADCKCIKSSTSSNFLSLKKEGGRSASKRRWRVREKDGDAGKKREGEVWERQWQRGVMERDEWETLEGDVGEKCER